MATTTITGGFNTPQKLFGDFPSQVSQMPGMVTPNITAAMPANVDWNVLQATQNAPTAQGWGPAQYAAESAAKQRAAQDAQHRQRLRAAFDEVYGPELQSAYHDRMVSAEKDPNSGVPNPYKGRTHEPARWSGSLPSGSSQTFDQYMADKGGTYKLGQQQLQQQLDNMWRMQTDPYLRAVSGTTASPSDMIRMMHPGGSVGGSSPYKYRGGGGGNTGGGGDGGGYGGTSQAQPVGVFPTQSLRQRTSRGPQYQYDLFGGR